MAQVPQNRRLLGIAEARLMQAQIIGSDFQKKNIILYQCGPSLFYADKLDGIFDINRRKKAPKWLVDQLAAGNFVYFSADGTQLSDKAPPSSTAPAPVEEAVVAEDGIMQG